MNIFDIVGPIMIGPSSSHTAGAVRIGRVAWKILGETTAVAHIGLAGSFAATYRGHGTDKALIAGLLGMRPDDERIRDSLLIADEQGLRYEFTKADLPRAHPNTAVLKLEGENGAKCVVEGVSVGGGNIQITKLNGLEAAFTGTRDTLIIPHENKPGVVAAVTSMLAHFGVNIDSFRLTRANKNELTIMTIEIDRNIEKTVVDVLKTLHGIVNVVYMKPVP